MTRRDKKSGFKKRVRALPLVFLGTTGLGGLGSSLPSLTGGTAGLGTTGLGTTGLGTAGSGNLSSLVNQLSGVNVGTPSAGALLGQNAIQGAQVNAGLFQLGQQSSDDVFLRDGAAKTYINALSNGTNVLADASSAKVGAGGGGGGGGGGGAAGANG